MSYAPRNYTVKCLSSWSDCIKQIACTHQPLDSHFARNFRSSNHNFQVKSLESDSEFKLVWYKQLQGSWADSAAKMIQDLIEVISTVIKPSFDVLFFNTFIWPRNSIASIWNVRRKSYHFALIDPRDFAASGLTFSIKYWAIYGAHLAKMENVLSNTTYLKAILSALVNSSERSTLNERFTKKH